MKFYFYFVFLVALSVGISGFENIALRKPATMNGVLRGWGPNLTNDGDKRNGVVMDHNSCSHTAHHQTQAWWQVNLENIFTIKTIGITYRQNFGRRLAGFSIFVSNTSTFFDGERCFHHTSEQFPSLVNNWTCPATGQYVTIYNERNSSIVYPSTYSTEAVLELCEVEVYGCPYKKFGSSCTESCFCSNSTCDYETGICPGDCEDGYTGDSCSVCIPGRYGDKCNNVCGHCKSDMVCDSVTGVCPAGCKDGWQPPNCNQECKNGHFGSGCSQKCGVCFNGESCDPVNGTCIDGCAPGYVGDICKEVCEPGRFGDGCNGQCGRCKEYTNCDPATGHCIYGCRDGWQEPECTKVCPSGYYGKTCQNKCGSCFKDGPCDHVSGNCKNGCKPGFLGDNCDKVCERGNHGLDCTNSCGNCYRDETCHHSNGTCSNGCLPGWQSPLCVTCVPGYFGPDCVHRCGKCLNQEPCNQRSGECINGCQGGWNGSHCEFKILYSGSRTIYVKKIHIPSIAISFLITALVVVGCIIIVFRQRRRQMTSDMKLLFSEAKSSDEMQEIGDHDVLIGRQENPYQDMDVRNK